MFKKTLIAALLCSLIVGCAISEDTEDESEEMSFIAQCDEQYNECVEKCGDPASEICVQQCDEVSEQCYALAPSESEDGTSRED